MDLLTYVKHLAGSGAVAYYFAAQIRDPKTRPNILATFELVESDSAPFLAALGDRAATEGDIWLAKRLATHATDEAKHGKIFAHALKQLNKTVRDCKNSSTTTDVHQSQQQRSSLLADYFQGYSPEQLTSHSIDWNVFMGSTYILELDASVDFARMANVLPEDDPIARRLKIGMLSIAKDETAHAAYLYEAMMRRMSATQVHKLVEEWRTRKANSLLTYVGLLQQ